MKNWAFILFALLRLADAHNGKSCNRRILQGPSKLASKVARSSRPTRVLCVSVFISPALDSLIVVFKFSITFLLSETDRIAGRITGIRLSKIARAPRNAYLVKTGK